VGLVKGHVAYARQMGIVEPRMLRSPKLKQAYRTPAFCGSAIRINTVTNKRIWDKRLVSK
jgi:hypothetical protein